MADHVPVAMWMLDINTAATSTAIPTAVTEGVAIPNGRLNEYSHVMVDANAGCSIEVMGYAVTRGVPTGETAMEAARWVTLDTFSRTGDTSRPWGEPLKGATAYSRVKVVRTDTNANCTMNAYVGLCEHWRGFGR